MCYNNYILTTLELHDDWLKTNNHVTIRFTATVTIVVFVVITGRKVFRVGLGDFLICQPVTNARVELVEGFPLEFGITFGRSGKKTSGLNGASESGSPNGEFSVIPDGLCNKRRKLLGVEFSSRRNIGVTTDFALEIVFRFAVLDLSVSVAMTSRDRKYYLREKAKLNGA